MQFYDELVKIFKDGTARKREEKDANETEKS